MVHTHRGVEEPGVEGLQFFFGGGVKETLIWSTSGFKLTRSLPRPGCRVANNSGVDGGTNGSSTAPAGGNPDPTSHRSLSRIRRPLAGNNGRRNYKSNPNQISK